MCKQVDQLNLLDHYRSGFSKQSNWVMNYRWLQQEC